MLGDDLQTIKDTLQNLEDIESRLNAIYETQEKLSIEKSELSEAKDKELAIFLILTAKLSGISPVYIKKINRAGARAVVRAFKHGLIEITK